MLICYLCDPNDFVFGKSFVGRLGQSKSFSDIHAELNSNPTHSTMSNGNNNSCLLEQFSRFLLQIPGRSKIFQLGAESMATPCSKPAVNATIFFSSSASNVTMKMNPILAAVLLKD